MDQCENCNTCIIKCPTNAIWNGKIRISAKQCLTFMNEGMDDFPEWVDPKWYQCLIGCMVCQNVCPANKKFSVNADFGCIFTEEETTFILQESSKDIIPGETVTKLKKLGMLEEYEAFRRNLQVLLNNVPRYLN